MSKQMKLGLLPAAIAGALLCGNAFAGTEACFEVTKGDTGLAVSSFDDIYSGSDCSTIADPQPGTIAFELTGGTDGLTVNFDELNAGNTGSTNNDLHIVYIPTTDIPGGTKIDMQLEGAIFTGNSNQIHLVKYNDEANDDSFDAVASSDGTFDDVATGKITFITKAGITISAGTRLAFSQVSTGDNVVGNSEVTPITVKLDTNVCSDDANPVTIKSISAITDGGKGYSIIGGVSKPVEIVDISRQFYSFNNAADASEANVNAESYDHNEIDFTARTQFVYEDGAANQLTVKKSEVIFPANFYNRGMNTDTNKVLDQAVELNAGDYLETSFEASSEAGSLVRMALWNSRSVADASLTTREELQDGVNYAELDGRTYKTDALELFTPEASTGDAEPNTQTGATNKLVGADYNKMYYVLTNLSDGVMNFNYDVNVEHKLTFADANELDHCGDSLTSHKIGVNGAVLKVPYMYNSESSFVRITNEHTEAAEVSVEVFDENDAANDVKTFTIGNVGATSSTVFFAPAIIDQYKTMVGREVSKRVTMTFTVTSPKDTVHGEAVLVVPGKTDRVMSVLDQNNWNQ